MRILNLRSSNKKRLRGAKAECSRMVKGIRDLAKAFPSEDSEGCGYYHAHLPVAQSLIDSKNTSRSIRKLCIQTLIDAARDLEKIKPAFGVTTRIVVAIDFPNLWDSQLIVFYGQDYFDKFFCRNTKEQEWTVLPSERDIKREWGLEIPKQFSVRGYKEEILDEDYSHVGEVWFIGEVL